MSVPYLTVEQLTEHSLNLSRERDRYKQAAEDMGKTGEKLYDYLLAHPAIIDIPDDLYIPWMNSLKAYSKLKEELK